VSGSYNVSSEEVLKMKELGLKWHEICSHFPAFGNYHPENLLNWRSGHKRKDETPITVDMIERTIKNLKEAGVGAFPYIQVTGDGKENKQGYAADAG